MNNTFSDLLSSFVHQKDIDVYPMTLYCGIDRSLMYKYLNGKDYPKDQSVIERMADFMRLSPPEHDDLITAWQIQKTGWKEWNSRQNVEKFLLSFPDISSLPQSSAAVSFPAQASIGNPQSQNALDTPQTHNNPGTPQPPDNASDQPCSSYPACRALPTQTALNNAVSQMILEETQKENGCLYLILQPDYSYLFHLLAGLGEYEHQISIRHILCLENSSRTERNLADHNLLCLQKLLPLYLRALDYNIYYYYDSVESHFSNLNGLSCLIMTSSCAITCTSDFQSGIFYGNPQIVQMLQNHFDSCQKKCSPLFTSIRAVTEICKMILKFFSESKEYYSLQPEPCTIPFLSEDILERLLLPELPNREELFPFLSDFLKQRQNTIFDENYHIFHTLRGLSRFMETGKIYEIPEDLYQPLSQEDRKLLLYRLGQFAGERYHFLRGPLENLPQNFHLWVSAANGYLMFTNRKNEMTFLLFTESSLLTAFWDYLQHMDETYLCSTKESQKYIEELLETE